MARKNIKSKKRRIPQKISKEYLQDLKMRDFLSPGLTDPEEIKLAKRYNVFKWTPFHEKNRARQKSSIKLDRTKERA